MRVFRIARKEYIEDLSGEGARLYGGRWNNKGYSMLYFSESLSLSLLEILVHLDFKYLPEDFSFLEVEIPDELINLKLKTNKLEAHWREHPPHSYSMNLGTNWLKSSKGLAMQVPSAVLPIANNILVNPRHKLISSVKIIKSGPLDIDNRVFKI